MTMKEIFDAFEKIGSVTFSTVDGDGYPISRIVHFLTYDNDGLYFFTMTSKPFYAQLKKSGKVSVCGLYPNAQVTWVDEKSPVSEPGYFIRITGDVREFTIEDAKAKNDPRFDYLIYDNERYPMITGFCIHNFKGEIYDYDFEKEKRGHKLERVRFAHGTCTPEPIGFTITDDCINCGQCIESCSFDALQYGEDKPIQLTNRCDECGNCVMACPMGAVIHKGT